MLAADLHGYDDRLDIWEARFDLALINLRRSLTNLRSVEATLQGASLSVPAVSADTYTVRVQSITGNDFDISRQANGTAALTCTASGTGGCPSSGTWG